MRKMLIATLDFPPMVGGVAQYLSGLARNLAYDKIILLAPEMDGAEEFDKKQDYKIYRKKLISRSVFLWPKWLPLLYHLFKIVRREKIEVVFVAQVLPIGTAAFIIKKILGIPYVVSCHGMDILTGKSSWRKAKLMNKIFAQAEFVVSNSEYTKNELIKFGVPQEKIKIVYPCPAEVVEPTQEKIEEIKNRYNLGGKKIILSVSRLVSRKGQDKVIEAMPKILEAVPEARYVIVGDGGERKKLEELTNGTGGREKIIFTGMVDVEYLAALYSLCDVFIMVSRQKGGDVEGFGLVYLEANQYGKPVIAGRSGGVREAVIDGSTGILVDPLDVNQISEALIKLLEDDSLANQLGERGRERVKKEFSWTQQIEKIKNLL